MNFYYAIFRFDKEEFSVQIPDVKGCWTQGKTIDEALLMATDALAGCLVSLGYNPTKSPIEEIIKQAEGATVLPVPIDEKAMKKYDKAERFNVIFPKSLLQRVDAYRKTHKMKRSELFSKAVQEYMMVHS